MDYDLVWPKPRSGSGLDRSGIGPDQIPILMKKDRIGVWAGLNPDRDLGCIYVGPDPDRDLGRPESRSGFGLDRSPIRPDRDLGLDIYIILQLAVSTSQ